MSVVCDVKRGPFSATTVSMYIPVVVTLIEMCNGYAVPSRAHCRATDSLCDFDTVKDELKLEPKAEENEILTDRTMTKTTMTMIRNMIDNDHYNDHEKDKAKDHYKSHDTDHYKQHNKDCNQDQDIDDDKAHKDHDRGKQRPR
ncbi:hypothetical protein ANN_28060 [Periplaneta americana]|uniref:Uncharacterized protein n=1 Tax=Periplaneta americana TaxID=6978 RepID=A0ABQ8RV68_PERAM|nr:hypothetical protein ANN_28060 [Periplaneta americana]